MTPRLIIVIPCYNEQEVLPITAPQFLAKIKSLAAAGQISEDSRILFVNDGSRDGHSIFFVFNHLTQSAFAVVWR